MRTARIASELSLPRLERPREALRDGSRRRRQRRLAPEGLTTSRLSEVEVASALARRKREGVCTSSEHELALEALSSDLSLIPVIEVASRVTSRARDLVCRHPLRAADAIHLASCLVLQDTTSGPVELVAFDRRLRDAAKIEGVAVFPPDAAS